MKEPREKKSRCCICGKVFNGYGHNPVPLKASGVCCDKCNELVIAKRLSFAKSKKNGKA